ncbi:hypothetical protein CCU22_00605 [Candidatus Legionella polyplacis]|uniref:hypothetical protein n=1 Tax=Candidatus Legionella polyplacis TaxID=2005262 RepID=UPI000C1F44D8|nr:hypothetical protein [Candidatus Legionella polyplacis]ATW01730.1 hypothetical protein CCU22_00605 [Candidatus Legionella polyplacis]
MNNIKTTNDFSNKIYFFIGNEAIFLRFYKKYIQTLLISNKQYETINIFTKKISELIHIQKKISIYPLLYKTFIFNIFFNEKKLNIEEKKLIKQCIKSINPYCVLALHFPFLIKSQLKEFSNSNKIKIIEIKKISLKIIYNWISQQLNNKNIQFDTKIPYIIWKYSKKNIYTCSKILKLFFILKKNKSITLFEAKKILDSHYYSSNNFIKILLTKNPYKIINFFQNKYEETKLINILYLLTNEIKKIIRLKNIIFLNKTNTNLKILGQYNNSYKTFLKNINKKILLILLQQCINIHLNINTQFNSKKIFWNMLENITLSLCCNKLIGTNLTNEKQ